MTKIENIGGYDITIEKHLPKQSTDVRVSSDSVRGYIDDEFDCYKIDLLDRIYKLVNVEHLKKKLRLDDLDKRQYDLTEFDCNRFTFVLLGRIKDWDGSLAFGKAKVKRDGAKAPHMLNVFIGEDMKLYYVEPQNDKIIIPVDSTYVMYDFEM